MIGSLMRAVVGLVVETPVSLIADVITIGGACVERDEPYTVSALRGVMRNVSEATREDRRHG